MMTQRKIQYFLFFIFYFSLKFQNRWDESMHKSAFSPKIWNFLTLFSTCLDMLCVGIGVANFEMLQQ